MTTAGDTRGMRYRVAADLRLFSDTPGIPAWRLYTRDASARGIGFVTRDRLPLGYGGVVQLPSPTAGPSKSTALSSAAATSATGGSRVRCTSTASSGCFARRAGGATVPPPPTDG